jgi:hypothetical protein
MIRNLQYQQPVSATPVQPKGKMAQENAYSIHHQIGLWPKVRLNLIWGIPFTLPVLLSWILLHLGKAKSLCVGLPLILNVYSLVAPSTPMLYYQQDARTHFQDKNLCSVLTEDPVNILLP